jgi:hypothetical protein
MQHDPWRPRPAASGKLSDRPGVAIAGVNAPRECGSRGAFLLMVCVGSSSSFCCSPAFTGSQLPVLQYREKAWTDSVSGTGAADRRKAQTGQRRGVTAIAISSLRNSKPGARFSRIKCDRAQLMRETGKLRSTWRELET